MPTRLGAMAADAKRSLHSHFSLVREAVWRFGDAKVKDATIQALSEADHAAVYKGEAVNESIDKVEDLLRSVRHFRPRTRSRPVPPSAR